MTDPDRDHVAALGAASSAPEHRGRRQWLAGTTALALAGGIGQGRVWALPSPSTGEGDRFIFVLLRGGYDALTLLAPSASLYREWRPGIAIPWATDTTAGARPLDADWALHPAAAQALAPLLAAGQIGFVPFAGTNDLTRSHFETQDTIEGGLPVGRRIGMQGGFLNRLAVCLGAREPGLTLRPIAFSEQLPLAFRGPAPVANLTLRAAPRPAARAGLQDPIARLYQGHALQARVDEAFALRAEVARQLQAEMNAADRGAVAARGFEAEARRIGLVLRGAHRLAFIDVGGWDTHVGQGRLDGPLPTRLAELGRGLVALAGALGPAAWARTTVVVGSEFGRTLKENGNQGTDHGHGSVWWVASGALAGMDGRPVIRGDQCAIRADTVHQDRDLPVLNDWRDWIGGLLMRQFGLDAPAVQAVFPDARPRDLGWL